MITFQNLRKVPFIQHGMTEISDIAPIHMVQGQQVHKAAAAWVSDQSPRVPDLIPEVDALATDTPGTTIAVRVADCVPLLFVHPQKKVVVAVHAGWRGTALHISRKTVEWLYETKRIPPHQLLIGMGPAIGPEDFIVDEIVAKQFPQKCVTASETEEGKFHVDLWQANIDQLVEAGVLQKNIEVVKRSTFADSKLYSARRGDIHDRNIAWIRIAT